MKTPGSTSTAVRQGPLRQIQQHATEKGWIPYFINLGDEPAGDDVSGPGELRGHRRAFPKGPPCFTVATS